MVVYNDKTIRGECFINPIKFVMNKVFERNVESQN